MRLLTAFICGLLVLEGKHISCGVLLPFVAPFSYLLLSFREHDVPFHCRVSIDMKINVGKWYAVRGRTPSGPVPSITIREDLLERPVSLNTPTILLYVIRWNGNILLPHYVHVIYTVLRVLDTAIILLLFALKKSLYMTVYVYAKGLADVS